MNRCEECDKPFSRRDAMLRHVRHVHRPDSADEPDVGVPERAVTDPTIESPSAGPIEFDHPFSMVVSGPSGSGKTEWTRRLLRSSLIRPDPQRIIWCYGQWQPLYDELQRQRADIEFVRGIPEDLGHPDFIRTSERNLLVLDDLMTEAKCDQRIADLFTKGRHHRNLSVMYLTQNLFPQGKACRDIALNTQYLVLFNNPIDRQQIATLARRVYPTRSQWFLTRFERAVQRPYGYLVVDLKPGTLESDRLRVDVFSVAEGERRGRRLDPEDGYSYETGDRRDETDVAMEIEPSEERSSDVEYGEERSKRYDAFLRNLVARRVNAEFESAIAEDSRRYPDEPADPTAAQHKAINAMLPEVRRKARFYLAETLGWLYYVEKSPLYETLMYTIAELMQSMSVESAAREAVRMYGPALDTVLAPEKSE